MYLRHQTHSRLCTIGAFALCAWLAAGSAQAGDSDFWIQGGGGGYQIRKVHTLLDLRFRNVVRQRYDYSCGSAAVATLLTYHYGHPVEEMDILQAMFDNGDKEKIRTEGFSMLDMKKYLEAIGYHAAGYRESLDKLNRVGIPAIVLINKRGYMHFVVVKGVTQDKVAVGDPTLGLRIYDRRDFEKMWNGILFILHDQKDLANASYNHRDSWASNGVPNFRGMLDNGQLGSLTITSSWTPNYY